jgi:DNA-binding response OmpR family regulator
MLKIIILEDDNLLRKMYSDKLKQSGYDVSVYGDGKSGFSAIKKTKPAVVLSDIMMPVMSGLDVLEAMKKDSALKHIPFVFLTNLARSDEDIQRGLELGAIGYLVKSDLTPNEIVAKVKEYAEAHKSNEELPERADERLNRAKKDA